MEAKEALKIDLGLQTNSVYIHASSKIEKYYRHENKFQIIPAHPSAPQPTFQMADHAFNLEYSFLKSSHSKINISRAQIKEREIILLLNSLLRFSLCEIALFEGGTLSYKWHRCGTDSFGEGRE